jgi:hypothetical protein
MWAVTGWAVATWFKCTLLLAAVVGVVALVCGIGSGWFWGALVGAGVLEVWAVRQLGREWSYEARSSWWWAP